MNAVIAKARIIELKIPERVLWSSRAKFTRDAAFWGNLLRSVVAFCILGPWNSTGRRAHGDKCHSGMGFRVYESPLRGISTENVHPSQGPALLSANDRYQVKTQVCSRDRHHGPSLNETFFRKFLSDARMAKHTTFFLTRFGKIHENRFNKCLLLIGEECPSEFSMFSMWFVWDAFFVRAPHVLLQ